MTTLRLGLDRTRSSARWKCETCIEAKAGSSPFRSVGMPAGGTKPALFISTSTVLPPRESTKSSTDPRSDRSSRMGVTVPPLSDPDESISPLIAAAAVPHRASLRQAMTTFAPYVSESCRDTSYPTPLLAPVTTTTIPLWVRLGVGIGRSSTRSSRCDTNATDARTTAARTRDDGAEIRRDAVPSAAPRDWRGYARARVTCSPTRK